MRRPFRRKKNVETESIDALHAATENLLKVHERGPEVAQLVQEAKILRERNHFAEQLEQIMWRRA